jgi:hypothetical protein
MKFVLWNFADNTPFLKNGQNYNSSLEKTRGKQSVKGEIERNRKQNNSMTSKGKRQKQARTSENWYPYLEAGMWSATNLRIFSKVASLEPEICPFFPPL